MPREVQDADGVKWTCAQAFAGLSSGTRKTEAARVEGTTDSVHVVCTPSGGSHSVRLALPTSWERELSDGELLQEIHAELG